MPPSLGQFGDARRQSAGTDLLARLVEVGQSGVSVRALGGSRSGEVRFESGSCAAMPSRLGKWSPRPRPIPRTPGGRPPCILAIQDTTTLRDDGNQRTASICIRRSELLPRTAPCLVCCTPRC